ncbi:MAG: DUF1684 domain-containing protein [Ferruginibacter sp.]
MKYIFALVLVLASGSSFAQTGKKYVETAKAFRAGYVQDHEVVTGENKKNFAFFPVNRSFAVTADFEELKSKPEVKFKTFAGFGQRYLVYGKLQFRYKGKDYHLFAYFSPRESKEEKYKNHLFIPFTDLTNGDETYGGGRYLDILTTDIKNGKVLLDFNKTYNPYCAYTSGYMCPIPPKENDLDLSVKAGEKNFKKAVH